MVNMFTPDFPIKAVEVIIMSRNFTRLKWWPGLDHVVSISSSSWHRWNARSLERRHIFAADKRLCLDRVGDQ
jgi:hypothetical protein